MRPAWRQGGRPPRSAAAHQVEEREHRRCVLLVQHHVPGLAACHLVDPSRLDGDRVAHLAARAQRVLELPVGAHGVLAEAAWHHAVGC